METGRIQKRLRHRHVELIRFGGNGRVFQPMLDRVREFVLRVMHGLGHPDRFVRLTGFQRRRKVRQRLAKRLRGVVRSAGQVVLPPC